MHLYVLKFNSLKLDFIFGESYSYSCLDSYLFINRSYALLEQEITSTIALFVKIMDGIGFGYAL